MLLTILLGMLPFIMVLGNSMLIPILPNIEQALHISPTESTLILTMFNIPAAFIIPIVGFFSDRFGRKILILISLFFIFVGGAICFYSGFLKPKSAFYVLLVGRFLQGLGTGGTTPLAMALIGDIFAEEVRAKKLAIIEVFNGSAKVLAPIFGAMLALVSWFFPFFVFPILSLILIIGIHISIKKASQGKNLVNFSEYVLKIKEVMWTKKSLLLSVYLFGSVGLFLLFGMLYYLSYQIEVIFKIDGFFKGFVFSFPLGALTISSYWTGKRVKSQNNYFSTYIKIGFLLMFFSFFMMIFFHSFSLFLFFITIGFGGLGFVLPTLNLLITSSVSDAERGIVVSLYGIARFLGVAFGPILFSIFLENQNLLFVISFLLLLLSQLFVLKSLKNGFELVKYV